MKAEISHLGKTFRIDLSKPLDISIPLDSDPNRVKAWYVEPVKIEAVKTENFVGDVNQGGSVNFRNITFNPHGNGTHTECVGHISKENYSINQCLDQFFSIAELISVEPNQVENGDQIIQWNQIEKKLSGIAIEAIVIRTLPNSEGKKSIQYSNTNPPYIEALAIKKLIDLGINHLLIDLPSVDKEFDEGVLASHHVFWEYPENTNSKRTITEMIYVPNSVDDGVYLLNIQIAPFENDASPSKPILYKIEN